MGIRRHIPEDESRPIGDAASRASRAAEPRGTAGLMAEQFKKAEARLAIHAAASRILELALVGSDNPDPSGEEGDR